MVPENKFYKAFVEQVTYGAEKTIRPEVEAALNESFLPKTQGIMPPPKSRRGVSNEEYFTLGNMALDTLKGLADHALVSGRGEVIDLTKLYVDSATRQIALNAGIYNGYPDPGGQLEATVAAARHHVLAVNALGELNASLFSRQPQGTDLLSYSAHQLYANPETVIRMFGTLHQTRIYSSIHANFEREALKKSPGR